jgi:hypothetical protein
MIPVVGGQSGISSWWGLQLVGNKQSNVDYTLSNVGYADDASVIIPNQQASKIGLLLYGASSQTGNLLELRNSTGTGLSAFTANGSLGLGTLSPAQKLDVNGTVKATGFQLPVSNYNASNQYIVKADANGNFTWTPFRDIQAIYASTWGANVNCAGYKLVGAAGSTVGLTVKADGTVRAHGFSCDSVRIADYVFDSGYKLRTLPEVEQFVQANKHLPDVPSAGDYQKRGQVDMAELQTLLLQKVEELTIYAIQQNKENQALKQRLSELEGKTGRKQ